MGPLAPLSGAISTYKLSTFRDLISQPPSIPLLLQSILQASNPIVRCGFLRLVAMFHGKLIRDLFITEKVIDMIRMIKVGFT